MNYRTFLRIIDSIKYTSFVVLVLSCSCATRFPSYARQAKSDNGVFDFVVAAADGLFIKGIAPTTSETANVLSHYSGSKSNNGINVQASCDALYRFCNMSIISPGSTNDWVSWNRSVLAKAVSGLPPDYHIIGDAAYPISDQLLTPYPGKNLPQGEDSFNFHLSQLRVKIEQSFGILVSTWGILWRPLRVSLAARPDLITALFHLHNFLQDEKVAEIRMEEEDAKSGEGRPVLSKERTLAPSWSTRAPAPSRSGETPARALLRMKLEHLKQWRPESNTARNN